MITAWTRCWEGLTPKQRAAPLIFVIIYWLTIFALGGLRSDHFVMGATILVLAYGGPWARAFYGFAIPFIATGIIYDSMRFYADSIRGPIHVVEPYEFDKKFFGITTAQGVLTPNEWFQLHLHPALDLITGFAYLVFFVAYIAFAAYYYFILGRKGLPEKSPADCRRIATRMGWGFLWLNLLGYSTYYWYAAAPPWYVSLYGLGPARLDVQSNVAGCARFDEILGTHFFTGMYGRAADVFGAIPSLHVAYPLLIIYFAFQLRSTRILSVVFYVLMFFSAIYLNHHYILDALWGSAYALIIGVATDRISDWRDEKWGVRSP